MKKVYLSPRIEVLEMEPMVMCATSFEATIEEPVDSEDWSDVGNTSPSQSGTELMTQEDWSSVGWN